MQDDLLTIPFEAKGKSYRLRLAKERDVREIIRVTHQQAIRDNIHWIKDGFNIDRARNWVKLSKSKGDGENQEYLLSIVDAGDGYIGSLNFHKRKNETFELGYWLDSGFHGKGIVTVSVSSGLGAFRKFHPNARVTATVKPANIGSALVLERNGFKKREELVINSENRFLYTLQPQNH